MKEQVNKPIPERLNAKQIPSLPSGAAYLLNTLSDENIDFLQVGQIIERFPAIAGRLIALANSAWSSPLSTITSVDVACSRLGFGVVRSTSIALAIAAPFHPGRCPGFSMEQFWCHAFLTAEAASLLSQEVSSNSGIEASTARSAGLLHNLGLLWLADQLPNQVNQAVLVVKENPSDSLSQTLSNLIGFNHSEAGGYLGSAWKLPEPLVTAMAHHAKPDFQGNYWETAHLVGVAASLVSAVQQDEPWSESDDQTNRLGITTTVATHVFRQIKLQYKKVTELAKILFEP